MSRKAVGPKTYIQNLEREAEDLHEELLILFINYQVEHHFMHCLIQHIRNVSADPARFANSTFVEDFILLGGPVQTLRVHVTELEERKGLIGAEMRRIQAASRELRVQRTEVLKAHKKLLQDGP